MAVETFTVKLTNVLSGQFFLSLKQTNKEMNKQQNDSLLSVARACSVAKASGVKVNMT